MIKILFKFIIFSVIITNTIYLILFYLNRIMSFTDFLPFFILKHCFEKDRVRQRVVVDQTLASSLGPLYRTVVQSIVKQACGYMFSMLTIKNLTKIFRLLSKTLTFKQTIYKIKNIFTSFSFSTWIFYLNV